MDDRAVFETIRDIPEGELKPVRRDFSVQGGKCHVWVTETLLPETPFVSDGRITFPYHVHRPDHKYNCVSAPEGSGHTTNPVSAPISGQVTAEYSVEHGKLIISNILDHGKNEETDGGGGIVRKLSKFS